MDTRPSKPCDKAGGVDYTAISLAASILPDELEATEACELRPDAVEPHDELVFTGGQRDALFADRYDGLAEPRS